MMPEIIHLAIRGYVGRTRQFEELLDLDDEDLDSVLAAAAVRQIAALRAHSLHMIEIEFLDEPDLDQRFFRFGTDPAGMVMPIEIDLSGGAS